MFIFNIINKFILKMKKNKDFEKGREYERKHEAISKNLFMGWALIVFSFIGLIGVYWTETLPLWICIVLFFIGIGNLWMGYDDKKRLKEVKR